MGFLSEHIIWAFFVYFGQLLSGLSLTVQEFWDCYYFQLAFSIAEGGQSSQHSNIFSGLRWPTVESQSFLAYFSQYVGQT